MSCSMEHRRSSDLDMGKDHLTLSFHAFVSIYLSTPRTVHNPWGKILLYLVRRGIAILSK